MGNIAKPTEDGGMTVYSSDTGPLYIHIVYTNRLISPRLLFVYGSMKVLNSSDAGYFEEHSFLLQIIGIINMTFRT